MKKGFLFCLVILLCFMVTSCENFGVLGLSGTEVYLLLPDNCFPDDSFEKNSEDFVYLVEYNGFTDSEFKKRIDKSPIGGFLFFGDEDYLKSHSLKTAIATSCPDPSLSVFNLMTVDPMSSDLPEALASALAAAPMMADAKTVELSGSINSNQPSRKTSYSLRSAISF